MIKKVIFPVGGLGTRFLPATKAIPKEMLPVANKPLIQYAFEEAKSAGIENFIFITGRNKNAIENHFDHAYELQNILEEGQKNETLKLVIDWMPKAGQIAYVRQQKSLGLGNAVYCAKNFVGNEAFLVTLADELIDPKYASKVIEEMLEIYEKSGKKGNIISVAEIDIKDSDKYGIIEKGNGIEIKSVIEKPNSKNAPSNLAIIGRYILQPSIFEYIEKTKAGKNNEVQLTDAIKLMIEDGLPFYFHKLKYDRFDCGSVSGYIKANVKIAINSGQISKSEIQNLL